ncbi:MAG: gliding motility-associated C-terminal domain-containing protein [Bacteroidota bacterium]
MYTRKKLWKYHGVLFLFLLWQCVANGQGCPVNIGFEKGDFTNWETLLGRVDSINGVVLTPNIPSDLQHFLYKSSNDNIKDPYGGFPINCPNGSGYSVRLGNKSAGAEAEGLNYTFTIPADRNDFSLIYNYAVVMQNPNHTAKEQPKFSAKVFNVTTGQYIGCSSFDYVAAFGLPGFEISLNGPGVLFKDWTPVTIKLSGYAGATIRLEFTTNDCTKGGHFGYAYVDVNENCLSPVLGNIVCQNDTELKLIAPYGFSSYKWFNQDFSKVLGTDNTLKQTAIPAENTVFAVELTPFPEQGCADTVYSRIHYSTENIDLKITQPTIKECANERLDLTKTLITSGNSPGLNYSYYLDPELTKKYYAPDSGMESGTYYIKATNDDGCFVSKSVIIKIEPVPVFPVTIDPKPVTKPATLDLTSILSAGGSLSYWMDAAATIPVPNPTALDKSGTYYIKITTVAGCSAITSVTASFVNPPVVLANVFSPNGDGVNDIWEMPEIKYYPESIIEIFNRTGQLLFRSVGYEKPWDGKQNGKDLPVGTYYYVIRLTKTDPPIGGSVTIIR